MSTWWDNFNADIMVPEEWREDFRMSKESFYLLCAELKPYIEKLSTNMRRAIDVECQVAVTLYYLSDEGRLRKSANAFWAFQIIYLHHSTSCLPGHYSVLRV